MKPDVLVDVDVTPTGGLVAVFEVDGGAVPLTRTQKQFNKLIDKLGSQRRELARWQAFKQAYHARLAKDYQPLATRLRDKRKAMVALLDRALDDPSLGKRQRDKVREILCTLLDELLTEAEDAELISMHDKHSQVSYADEQEQRLEALRTQAAKEYGLNVDAYEGEASPDEFADWVDDQMRAAATEEQTPPPPRKKSARALAREALREQTAEGGTRAVRDVFRRLASELHPDREPDAVERGRKTELMKQVNQAYKASDLLALLELQLSIEQIDQSSLAGLAEDRLKHYCHVLEEQSQSLREEFAELIAPFTMALTDDAAPKLTPAAVIQSLDMDIRDLKAMLKDVELMLTCFRDIRHLKQSLGRYQFDSARDDDWDEARAGAAGQRGRRR